MVALVACLAAMANPPQQNGLQIAPYPMLETAVKAVGDPLTEYVKSVAKVYRGPGPNDLSLDNGLVRRTISYQPTVETTDIENVQTGVHYLENSQPEDSISINGQNYILGAAPPETPQNTDYFRLTRVSVGTCSTPFDLPSGAKAPHYAWPPRGIQLTLLFTNPRFLGLMVEVHHELYDGLPVFMKRIIVRNNSESAIRVDRYATDALSPGMINDGNVSGAYILLHRLDERVSSPANLFAPGQSNEAHIIEEDVQARNLRRISSTSSPNIVVPPGLRLDGHRSFVFPPTTNGGLLIDRMNRTFSPWIENRPFIFLLNKALGDESSTIALLDQISKAGFSAVMLGSQAGVDPSGAGEREFEQFAKFRRLAYTKGLGTGLLANVVQTNSRPEDQLETVRNKDGNDPLLPAKGYECLATRSSSERFAAIRTFLTRTGFTLFLTDGYDGSVCGSTLHLGHQNQRDSFWQQWKAMTGLEEFCRLRGTWIGAEFGTTLTGLNTRVEGLDPTDKPRLPIPDSREGVDTNMVVVNLDNLSPTDLTIWLERCLAAGEWPIFRGSSLDQDQSKILAKWLKIIKDHQEVISSPVSEGAGTTDSQVETSFHINPFGNEKAFFSAYNPTEFPKTLKVEYAIKKNMFLKSCRISRDDGKPEALVPDKNGIVTRTFKLAPGAFAYDIFQ